LKFNLFNIHYAYLNNKNRNIMQTINYGIYKTRNGRYIKDIKQIKNVKDYKIVHSYPNWPTMNHDIKYKISICRFDIENLVDDRLFDFVNILKLNDLTKLIISYLTANLNLQISSVYEKDKPLIKSKNINILVICDGISYEYKFNADGGTRLKIKGIKSYNDFDVGYFNTQHSLQYLIEIIKNEVTDMNELNSINDVLYVIHQRVVEICNSVEWQKN
jgi:hypothetical protein